MTTTAADKSLAVIDDEAGFRLFVRRVAESCGFQVFETGEVPALLGHLRQGPPTAIILDLRMPLAASLTFLRSVRAVPELATIPVAIVTSDYHLNEPQEQEVQALGAQLHYTPLWLNELVTLARDLVIPRD